MKEDIMALKNIGIDIFKNIIAEARHNTNLLDSYSPNQFKSKESLIKLIQKLELLNPHITILGSWYGSILIPAFVDQAKKITCIDLEDMYIRIAKNRLFKKYKNIEYYNEDVFDPICHNRIKNSNLIINTSCEHMSNMSELPALYESNAYFAFQSNNMYDIPTHINCVASIDEFYFQLPHNATVIAEDEVEDDRGTRFTLIGKLCAE